MTSKERHDARYRRRIKKREIKRQQRSSQIGGIDGAMSYHKLYKCGKDCCCGVRWKQSTQNFELHIFTKTAINAHRLKNGIWEPDKYNSFLLAERGKIRPIDAPNILDRQVQKAYTRNVLLPLYLPDMIWNNGASLKGKGFTFSKNMLIKDLHSYYRRYGTEGSVILLDFKQFFPSAPHKAIYDRHNKLILDDGLRVIGDKIVASNKRDFGMPLGVEASQAEMIALPSPLDNFIKCQLSMKYVGHYMDDYYILVPPHMDAKELLRIVAAKASAIGFTISKSKTKIFPLRKPFKYCKAKYTLTESGAVIVNGNRDSMKRARRKIRAFKNKITNNEMSYIDLWSSINGILSYFDNYHDHNRVLKLRRYFYSQFGFSPEYVWAFKAKERDRINGIYCTQQI